MPTTLFDFVSLCDLVSSVDGVHEKILHLKRALCRCDDPKLLCKLLLPQCDGRVYGIQSKQLAHFYSKLLNLDTESVNDSFESTGDPSAVAFKFHTLLEGTARESTLTLVEIDQFLDEMHRGSDKFDKLHALMVRCTPDDIRIVVRLLNRNLKINAGPRCVLGAFSDSAYTAYTLSKDLSLALNGGVDSAPVGASATVSPMLAAQCRSLDQPFVKFPNGVLCEIKYDGERVQIHRFNGEFTFYTRALKRVQDKKIASVVEHVRESFPPNTNLIVDSEILMIDRETGEFLPFGTLGVHKRKQFKNAQVCLVLFDCLHYNGSSLCDRPLHERRSILEANIVQIDKRIVLSEQTLVATPDELRVEFEKALGSNREGLMLKGRDSHYAPGKRRWLKLKRDYFKNGADTADLVVLGASYGTGRLSGKLSVFLVGCRESEDSNTWIAVTRVHSGLTDQQIDKLHGELMPRMVKHSKSTAPSWTLTLNEGCKRTQFVAIDPRNTTVFEISCSEITEKLSFRFPRFIRERTDKDWRSANTLDDIRELGKREAGANPPTKRIRLV